MGDLNLAFAFTAGILATINPCGFAMLPAYVSYFLGIEANSEPESGASIGRALVTGSTVSAGFLIVFGLIGVLVTAGLTAIREVVPWIAIGIGFALMILETTVMRGGQLSVVLPKFEKGTKGTDLRSLLLFGVSYAVASVSCGLPTFIVVVSTSVSDFASGFIAFVFYALGMSVTLLAVTISLALARSSFLNQIRALVRFVDRASGLLMIMAGIYLVTFWLLERTGTSPNWFVTTIEGWSSGLNNAITALGGVRTGILLTIVIALGLIVWLLQLGQSTSESRKRV